MNDKPFIIKAYGKSELAMLYLPHLSKYTALRQFRTWLKASPSLRYLLRKRGGYFTPKEVRKIVKIVGEPFSCE